MRTDYLLQKQADIVLAALTDYNRLVMRVAMHTGLRIGDVLALKTAELAPKMWITEAKTGKRRQIGLPKKMLDELKKYSGDVWVFPNRLDPMKHRTRQAVWKDVKRAAKAFRFKQNVAPHSFRKLYAVKLLDKYHDLERVRRALNHSEASTTMIYALADKLLSNNA